MAARYPRDFQTQRDDAGARHPGCLHECARDAGGWTTTPSSALDPWDEIARQQEIHDAALAVAEAARQSLIALAARSQAHRHLVSCDQDDWGATIADSFTDLVGDTFGCLPRAISRAKRDLSTQE